MRLAWYLRSILIVGLLWPACLAAQSAMPPPMTSDDPSIPLGDLARALRRSQALPSRTVIDNDNLIQVMDEVQGRRLGGGLLFSFDGLGKTFHVSSPDVTCSLSFNAQASSLLSDPFVPRDLPASELVKLEGPATIAGDTLQVSVHNGTGWDLREITVGLTILRRPEANADYYSTAKLLPAAAAGTPVPAEKHSDMTVLYRLKGAAAPFSTTVFHETLTTALSSDQDWHWAIVQAKGIPPKPIATQGTQ